MATPSMLLPLYECHKKVRALKIRELHPMADGQLRISPEDTRYSSFVVEARYVPKHDPARPQVGWYFVLYEDGYKSFSPPEAFEKGYTLVTTT